MTDHPSSTPMTDDEVWLAKWLVHCRESWQRMQMLRDREVDELEAVDGR